MRQKINLYTVLGIALALASAGYKPARAVGEYLAKQDLENRVEQVQVEREKTNQDYQLQVQAKPQEKKSLIDYAAIEQIESAGNPKAYNRNSKATGLRQITPVVLQEWNQFNPKEKYNLENLFDSEINRKIGSWYMDVRIPNYLRHYGLEDSMKNRIVAYNWGIGNLRKFGNVREDNLSKLPEETRKYIEKYRKLTSAEI